MLIAVLLLFTMIAIGCWFAEDTKIGRKLTDKAIDRIMKG